MAASRWLSTSPKSFISSQTLRLKSHERQNSSNTVFFPSIEITGTKEVSVARWAGGGCAAGFAKVLPFTRPNFANFVTLYQIENAHLFLISVFCE